jgi:hypothetical protein
MRNRSQILAEAELVFERACARAGDGDVTSEELREIQRLYGEWQRSYASAGELRDALRTGLGLSRTQAERIAAASWRLLDPATATSDAAERIRRAAAKLKP